MSPWNYPVMLSFSPLIGAISAGNCVILKPSEIASATQRLIVDLVNKTFPSNYIHALNLDANETIQLLAHRFDYIFFTGSTAIGKKIMAAAAKHLTPLTLELGGKSPCIIDETANLDFAARRIIWAKMMNAGQTCIAPDYLYVQTSCKEKLIEKLILVIKEFYGEQPQNSASFGRIINKHHFDRLSKLLSSGHLLHGGKTDEKTKYIEPTLIEQVTWHDELMQEEIFGPILPILTFDQIESVIDTLKVKEKPLALYLFSQDKKIQDQVMNTLSFGGGCLNDCLVHIANLHLPFGGVGYSGIGSYHGEESFNVFSHLKSIYKKVVAIDLKLEYPPYSSTKLDWIKRIFRWS